MYALVENEQFVKILNSNKGFTGTADNIELVNITDEEDNIIRWSQEEIDNGTAPEGTKVGQSKTEEVVTQQEVKYSRDIFTKWTEEERNAIGVYSITIDSSNKKDEEYYVNTDISYSYANGVVTGSYGTPTAKPLNNILFVQGDEIPEGKAVGDIKQYGLKEQKISTIKEQAAGLLAPTDWHVIKATEVADYSVPADITTFRAAVRTRSNEMETAINNAGDVDALKALFTYTEDNNGNITRPLGEWPEEVI